MSRRARAFPEGAAPGAKRVQRCAVTLLLAIAAALAAPARAQAPDSAMAARFARLKALELDILRAEAAEELDEGPSLERGALRRPREPFVPLQPLTPPPATAAPAWTTVLPPANHRLNDPASEPTLNSTQAEPSIAAIGARALAAWNDGEILQLSQNPTPSGLSVGGSVDGGRTWRKFGSPPLGTSIGIWTSDPVVAADERRGRFFLTGLVVTAALRNGIGVVRATLADTGVVYEPPVVARAVRDTLPDKPWMAADSLTGRVYLVYTSFFRIGTAMRDQIEFQRSEDAGRTWSPPQILSSPSELGLVQGGRVAVGPDGELHVAWKTVDTTRAAHGRDWIRIRTSRDGGVSFGPSRDVTDLFTNFGSGAPGYNRPWGFAFPSLAVDRSDGPFRGRVYASWNESVSFYADTLGRGSSVAEAEPDNTPAAATPFAVGQTLRGTMADGGDADLWRFRAARGQTVVLYLDSLAAHLDVSMRLEGIADASLLAYSAPLGGRERLIVLTIATSGEYYLRVNPILPVPDGGYRILTAFHRPGGGRARDHRDVFVAHSDDGFRWSVPVRVNDDAPWFDDWLPEVGVSATGKVVASWFDWRNPPDWLCGSWSMTFAAVSSDGGDSWSPNTPLADAFSPWPQVQSNEVPNQGDYIAMAVSGESAWCAWADGRSGNPDVYSAVLDLAGHPAPPPRAAALTLDGPWPNPVQGPIAMRVFLPAVRTATIELLDMSGRRWRARSLVPRAAGWQWLDLGGSADLPPGVYVAHATQGGAATARKLIVLR